MKETLEKICRQYSGINRAELSKLEENVLVMAQTALGWKIKHNEHGEIYFLNRNNAVI
jgi:hypothetical protein